jgi:hypothetical protein
MLADLLQGLQGLEGLFKVIVSVLAMAFFLAIVLLIVFWGAISTFFGSIIGSALNRTIAEREYIQRNQGSNEPQSPYHTEEQAGELKRPALRGCGFQILATLLGAGTFYIMFEVLVERRFEASVVWWCILVSLMSAGATYYIRQTNRRKTLPEHLSEQGRFRLYLTWLYLCLFTNVVLAGIFGIWILDVSAVASVAAFVYQNIINRERDQASKSKRDDSHT